MSKSLQKGIIFAVCILLVCALGVTLFIFDGTGGAVTEQEGQASAVAQNMATYTHGSKIGRALPSDYTSVSDGTALKAAIEANNKDIVLTNDVTLQTNPSDKVNNYLWNDNSQCFDSDLNGNTDLKVDGFTHKIYGQGYTIEVQGPHGATGDGMQQNDGDTHDYGGLFPKLGNNGAVYDVKIYITKGFSVETYKTWSGAFGSGNDEWLNVGGIAGSLIGNAVIDNVTVEIASGVKLASYKWSDGSSTSQYVRVGAIAGEINNTASISNVTVINNGRLESGQYTSQAKFSPDSDRYYGAAGNVVGWISSATSSINNVRVEGSGTLYSYYVANIANAIGSTVSVNNFYNNFTGTFNAKYKSSNTLGQGEGATSTLTVTNHYKKGALASSAGTDNTVVATNTLTVPNNLTLYFIPKATQDSDRLGIAFSGTTYSSANDYTVTGLNNAEKTASGGFSAAPSGGTLALGLPVGANNWKTDGTFASITATPKFNPSSYAKLTKYDHGYVDPDNRTTNGTAIGTGEDFEDEFSPSGTISGTDYYLTNDIVITGFTGKEFSGTLDGNGHTIFITGANTCAAQHIGGIVGTLTGTIKNVRVVLVNSVTANTSVSNANVGLVAGHINGGSLINVSVDIPADVTLKHTDSGNDSSLGGIAGSAVSGATFTNVTMNFNGTLSNIKTSGASGGYWPFTSAFVGKPSVSQGTNSPANSATFNNIIIRGNGTFASQSSADDEPPYYAAIGIIQHKGVTNSTAAVYNVNGLIYDFNPQFADNQGATSGNHGACYGLFVNNNNNNAAQVQYYDSLVNYGSNGVYNASGKVIEAYAFNENGNAPVPNPSKIKNITETVTGVDGSTVKAYFMPGDSASENLTLVASASNWNGVTQLQLDGAAPAVTSADDGSNKVVNVAKSTAVNISGNLTLSPYNPYTVITASLVTDTKVYDGNPFAAQVSFAVGGSPVSLTDGQYTITYTDGNATGETNANVGDGNYSLTVTLTGTASDGTQYVFDAQGTKTKTFTYTITPLEVTGTWSVSGLEITYGDAAPDYDQYISIELTNEGTIPGGLTATDITGSGFTSNYTSGTRAGETVTITAGTFTVGSGFTASNYNFRGITGSGSVEVQKKELTITNLGDDASHITDSYGSNVTSLEDLATLFETEGMSYVQGLYGSDAVTFAVTALTYDKWYDDGAEGALEEGADAASLIGGRLYAKTYYTATVTLASDNAVNDNYKLAEGSTFVYYIEPLVIEITGAEFAGGGTSVLYDGNAHEIQVVYTGALDGDNLTFTTNVFYNSESFEGTQLTNAGSYEVTIGFDPQNTFHGDPEYNYDVVSAPDEVRYTLTITPVTLTINDISGNYTDYTVADIVIDDMVSGILEGDTEGVTVTPAWDTPLADEDGWLAANTYNATLSLGGDKAVNYTFGSDNVATVTVSRFDLSGAQVTITSAPFTYNGNEQTVLYTVLTGEGGKDITSMLTPAGDKQTNAGDTYTLTLTGGDNFTNQTTATWSIGRAKLSVTAPTAITFMDKAASELSDYLTTGKWITGFFGSDGYALAWTNDPEDSAVPIGDVAYAAAGTYTANVQLTGENADTNYELSENTLSVTVNAYDLSNAEMTVGSLTYNGEEQTADVTVTANGADVTALLTVSGNTAKDAGSNYTAKAEAKDSNFNGSIEKTFTVAQKQLKLESLTLSSSTYTGAAINVADHTFAADFGPVGDEQPELSIVEETGATVQDAGTYTFDVTLKEASTYPVNANYVIAADGAKITATVSPASVTVTAAKQAELGALYGVSATAETSRFYESDFITFDPAKPDGTFTLADALTFTVTNSSGPVSPVGDKYTLAPGTYTVTYTIKDVENANYTLTAGDTLTTTLTVKEGALKLTITGWNNTSLTYNGMAQLPTPVFADSAEIGEKIEEGALVYEVTAKEGALTGSDAVNAGSYTVTVSVAAGFEQKYELVGGELSTDFTIAPATLNITQTAEETLTRPYDGTTTEATSFLTEKYVTITGGVSGENIYGMLNASLTEGGEIKNAGAYTITVTFNAEAEGAGNYSVGKFTSLEIVYTVTAKTITITFDGYEGLTYNGQARTLTATADFVSGESIDLNALIAYTGDITNGEAVNAGSYTATITKAQIEKSNANYTLAAESATQEFTISPATLTLTQTDGAQLSRVYDGTVTEAGAFVSEAYFTVSGYMDGGNEYALFTAAVAEGLTIQNADSYTINITLNSEAEGAGNYVLAEDATVEFTIARKTVSVAWENTAFTYNGLAQVPTANVGEAQGLITGDDLQITVSGAETDANTDGGSYTATAEITGGEDMGNYVLDGSASTSFTIAPKSIGVEWTNTAFEYDGAPHKPTATATGLVGDDSLTLTVTGEQTNAGSYTATVEAASVTGNYKLAEDATIEFTIAPKSIGVKWTNTAFEYNGSAQVPTATATDLVGGDSLTLTVTGEQTNAGSYTATVAAFEQGNYKLAKDATIEFTIAPKPITITFTANDSANPINFDVAGSVTVGETWTIDGGNAGRATLVLSDGTTDITLTVEAASGEALPTTEENVLALLLLLDGKLYEGTPYGTKVEGGSLTVISADPNYVFEGAQAITLNITPAISVVLQAGVQTTLGLTEVLKTGYNAEYFKENYLKVINKGGEEVTGGTLEVTITPPEGVELLEGVIKHAGTYTVTAVYKPGGAEESAGAELPTFSFEFTVTPVEVTSVTYSGGSFVYGDLSASGKIEVTVEYADGKKAENVTAQYTSENVSNAGVVKAGEQTIKVSYTNDDSDYAAVTEHEITLTVEKKAITATINYGEQSGTELTLTYNGSVGYTIGAELNDVLSGDGVSAEVLQSFIDVAALPYEVEITLDGNDKDNYMVEGEYTVTITPADVTYEWNFAADAKITYGDSVEDVKALAVMPDGALLGVEGKVAFQVSVGDYSATTNAGTEVTFDVSYTLPEGAKKDNYNITVRAADGNTLTVDKATLTLAIADAASLTKVYDGNAVTLDSLLTADNVSVGGMKNGEDAFTLGILAISGTDEMTNAGTYNGSVSVIENCNYTAEAIEITYTVTPKPISVAWSNTEFTYDGTAHKPTATAVGLVEGDSLTLTVTGEQTNANAEGETYTATVKAFEQGNYKLESDSTQTFTIKKAAAALAIKDYDAIQASVYKGSAFVVTPLLNGAEDTQGIVEVEFFDKTNSSATVAVQEIKNAGVYTVTLTVNNANYEYAQSSFTVTVSPKSIGVEWSESVFTYNGSAQVPTATATGLEGGDSLTLTVTGAQTNAGSYTATVAAFEQGNYKLESDITQAFTIAKADLTVTPDSLKIRERETEAMQAFAEGEDLVEAFAGRINVSGVSGTVIYTVTIAGENNYDDDGLLTVGAHTFTIDAGDNYNAASVSVTVIATPVVTVIASVEGELVYNGSAFEISYALKEGAPVDVSMDDITVTASVETIVNAGEYEVTFTVTGSNEDYDYVVQDASGNAALTFTIARRGLDVAEVAEAVYGDLQVSGTLVTGTHTAFVAYNDEEIELIVNVKTAALSRAAAEYLDAGEYEVTIALANEQGNFSLNGATLNAETEKMEVESTLDVAPKTVTVGYTPSSPVYDAKGISITLDKFEGMLIEGDDPAVNIYINDAPYTGKVVLDAGEYTVRYESADPNYAFAPVSATFTIAPKSVTPNFDLNTGSGSQQITGGGKLEIEEGEETDIVAAIDNFMQSSGVSEEEMSIAVSGDLKLEDMATWAPGTYTVKVTLSGNHSGSMQFTVEVSEKIELPPPVAPELPETPVEAGSGNDWVLPLVIAIVALIDLALLVAIGVAAKKRA